MGTKNFVYWFNALKPSHLFKKSFALFAAIALLSGVLLTACVGQEKYESGPSYEQASSVFVADGDVYVVGRKRSEKGYFVATVWKNGVPQLLATQYDSSMVTSVFVSGNDVYVAGYQEIDLSTFMPIYERYATLWKNGIPQMLFDNAQGEANSVFVSGEDVYVAGHFVDAQGVPTVALKNGVPLPCSGAGTGNSIYVVDGDVYVAGLTRTENSAVTATLWKNGVPQNLSDGSLHAYAESVFVSGENVYVAGCEYKERYDSNVSPFLWTNGIRTMLPHGYSGQANSVFVSNGDIYVVGYDLGYHAIIWKNNEIFQRLAPYNDFPDSYYPITTRANSIFVSDDVYVAGSEEVPLWGGYPRLWKNGELQTLK